MNWKQLISDLQERGYTQPRIAAICGCAQATISAIASGKTLDPKSSLGDALRALRDRAMAEPIVRK